MSFVSYAQNAEDVMLWRALKPVRSGFYIDAGAQDPETDSVTRAFYDRGWRGVNVEPVPAYADALAAARPRDVTLRLALGATAGKATFFRIPDTGLSTLDPAVAALQRRRGWRVDPIEAEIGTLAALCRAHAPADIHFLKIDVEGGEAAVLRGADFAAWRPWIVLVEATLPNSREESWAEWEPILLAADYRFVWFDGLNRFYLAAERHAELAEHFRVPPNIYDGYRRDDPEARRQHRAALADVDTLRVWNAAATRRIAALQAELAAAQAPRPPPPEPTPVPARAAADAPSALPPPAVITAGERPRGPLRRLLRPLAVQARAFLSAELRRELAATADEQLQALRRLEQAQATFADQLARAARPQAAPAPAEVADLAQFGRLAESVLLTLAIERDQPAASPSAAHSRKA